MSKHTPGPWSVVNHNNEEMSLDIVSEDRPYVCTVWDGALPKVTEANAHLISAAPDLLIELRQSIIQMEMAAESIEQRRYDEALLHVSSMMRTKKEAIAKALGESE